MAVSERINPKTKAKEYKVRYYFYADGKKKDSETSWFPSKEAAQQEAVKLKEEKEKADKRNILQRRDKRISVAFEDFIEYLKARAETELTNSYELYAKNAKTLLNKHTSDVIKNTRTKDITPQLFRDWVNDINNNPDLAGRTVGNYRLLIRKFNNWLAENGYYLDDTTDITVEIVLSRMRIKSRSNGNRVDNGERAVLSPIDLKKISYYWINKKGGLGAFRNFYYYTFFTVLFYSGLRPEEARALQWKHINLNKSYKTIEVVNALPRYITKERAQELLTNGINLTKTKESNRIIPIFDIYYQLLVDYKQSYKYEFGLDNKAMRDCFVFPKMMYHQSKAFPNEYYTYSTMLTSLKFALEGTGLPNTDLQMFRHSCATFLILKEPEGLGYTEEQVKDYFGHSGTEMLQSVYAKLNKQQKAERMRGLFKDIYTPEVEEKHEKTDKEIMIDRVRGDNKAAQTWARKNRIYDQITQIVRDKYYYSDADKEIIEDFKKDNPEVASKIEFVLENE